MNRRQSSKQARAQSRREFRRKALENDPRTFPYPMEIVWETTDMLEVREFHVTLEISPNGYLEFYRPYAHIDNEEAQDSSEEKSRLVAEALLTLDGVCEVYLYPYSVCISIGKAFQWIGEKGRMDDILETLAEVIYHEPVANVAVREFVEEIPEPEISDDDGGARKRVKGKPLRVN